MVDFLRNQLPPELQKVFAGLAIASVEEILAEKDGEYSQPRN